MAFVNQAGTDVGLSFSPISVLDVAPQLIPEQQMTLFKFYLDQVVQDGMTYQNELYRLERQFTVGDRLEAYQFGCELHKQGFLTLISASKQRYAVWSRLRSRLAIP